MTKQRYYFGESARYFEGNEEQEKEAEIYLTYWKKFLIQKLNNECFKVNVVDEQWGERSSSYISTITKYKDKWLKIAIEIEFRFEINQFIGSQ